MTLISFLNLIRTGLLMVLKEKSFFFLKYLKWQNADCFSYLLGKYSGYKINIMSCWGEIYSQPPSETILTHKLLLPRMVA